MTKFAFEDVNIDVSCEHSVSSEVLSVYFDDGLTKCLIGVLRKDGLHLVRLTDDIATALRDKGVPISSESNTLVVGKDMLGIYIFH